VYDIFAESLRKDKDSKLGPGSAAFAAASAAACASVVGNPTDRALVLMQTGRTSFGIKKLLPEG